MFGFIQFPYKTLRVEPQTVEHACDLVGRGLLLLKKILPFGGRKRENTAGKREALQ